MSILMSTESQNFQNIMGNGSKYKVPRFQRDYSWEEEQWEDLWTDIQTLREEKQHYMGYLVLQTGTGERQLIIDGQQRLTTLSIIVLSALKRLKELSEHDKNNEKRAEAIRTTYIGTIDTVSLTTYNKVELNRNNDTVFKKLSSLETPPVRKVKRTNKLMTESFDFFYKKLQGRDGKEIAAFIELMSKGLMFTKISVDNEINAYKVFETLNARGVQLSTPDLLKNYLFSIISKDGTVTDEEMDDLDIRWEEIVKQLERNSFSDFLRFDWNSQNKTATKNELFRKIRNHIASRTEAHHYLKRLEKRSQVYAALFSAEDELWQKEGYKGCSEYVFALELFGIKQPMSVFLVAYEKFEPHEFVKLMRYISILSMRYNTICKRSPNEQERIYNQIALSIHSGEYKRASSVKNSSEFKKIYPSDDDFIQIFKNKRMPHVQTLKKIKHILLEIERHLSDKKLQGGDISVEHILPKTPDGQWRREFGDDWEDCTDRLGNMTLLTINDNKLAGRKLFTDKKPIYENSGFKIAEKISDYDQWNIDNLKLYQHWLAEQAANTWKINYS
ncbi:MAG: DUF262 domain-containing HNH endonuclease family protein [Pseudomonadota bacterium]